MLHLGWEYLDGNQVVEKNTDRSLELFGQLIEMGELRGLQAAISLFEGRTPIIGKNEGKLFEYIERFLKRKPNHPFALRRMGRLYVEGKGRDKDLQTGFEYLRRASRLGNQSDSSQRLILKLQKQVDPWYHHPHPDVLSLLLLSRHFQPDSLFFVDYLPLDIFKIIWKEAQIGKFPYRK